MLDLTRIPEAVRSGCGSCRNECGPGHTASAAPDPFEAPFGGQKTCLVSGAALSEISNPSPVSMKGQTVYVCCPQCAVKLRADPDAYLAKATAERSGRATALPAATPTAGPYAGQKTCPVTGEEPDPAGGAIPVAVRGQTIYVCCPGCAAKVKSDPEPYLNKVLAERSAR